MTTSMMRVAALVAVAALTLGVGQASDDLDALVQTEMSARNIKGLSMAIIQDGRIQARVYGVTRVGGPPVTPGTLFQAGSISKPVAALGALRLVERGTLALDEDVNTRLTSWKVPDNEFTATEKVTLRRLLSHSAGLTVHGFPGYNVKARIPSTVEVLDGAGNTAPVRVNVQPGSLWRYSGGGYTVAQLLISDVTATPFAQYMHDAVLRPLSMISSTYEQPLPEKRAALTAAGYRSDGSEVAGQWHVYPEMAAAGLWTTPTDLAKFAIEVQQALAGKAQKVISPSMTRQMLTPQKDEFGLGFALSGSGKARTFGHNGRDEGFDARLLAFAETGQGVVIMINVNENSGAMGRIADAVARKYQWPERTPPPARK